MYQGAVEMIEAANPNPNPNPSPNPTLARYVDIDPDDPHNVLWPKLLELVC